MTHTREIIPKDFLICDTCNKQVSDENFIALEDMIWYEGWLYCGDCVHKYNPKEMKVILKIEKYDNLSDTDLAKPMVFESW
jgi:transcription elongation factor Elf1